MNKNNNLEEIKYNLFINEFYINKPFQAQMIKGASYWKRKTLTSSQFKHHLKKGHSFAPLFAGGRVVKQDF